ncbi:hypothetical protein GOP47_0019220 [Adiantum capillus-veneris]|uniref:Uncharacterized protein n=1 Tax=Adiantum capillus-veneris TaxID=13818 RepID=A0A9D4ZBF5_ADICA|nr:hypothetical protein GOP47_0019220 [Adiantum capillus-veneris]
MTKILPSSGDDKEQVGCLLLSSGDDKEQAGCLLPPSGEDNGEGILLPSGEEAANIDPQPHEEGHFEENEGCLPPISRGEAVEVKFLQNDCEFGHASAPAERSLLSLNGDHGLLLPLESTDDESQLNFLALAKPTELTLRLNLMLLFFTFLICVKRAIKYPYLASKMHLRISMQLSIHLQVLSFSIIFLAQ